MTNVLIDEESIYKFSINIDKSYLLKSEYNKDTLLGENYGEEEYIAFVFVYNSLNFSYWGYPKWTINIQGNNYDGSAAMIRAIKRAITEGHNILNSKFLINLTKKQLSEIFRGNIEIPLFKERLKLLNILGELIENKYQGSFKKFIDEAKWDAELIVEKLSKELPDIFNDTNIYIGQNINFYKRAQLIPAHLYDLYNLNIIKSPIYNIDKLTAFADYKVPQLMRNLGIIKYSSDLSYKIDNLIEIPAGSNDEIEIRIATIWAIELCTRQIKKYIPQVTSTQVHGVFWFSGQKSNIEIKPYHRTRTIWY